MNRHRYTLFAVAAMVAIQGGCGDERLLGPGTELVRPSYRAADRPENVVANLVLAYQHRDIEGYARLLAPEFIYRFQPGDVAAVGRESWGREEDVRATGNMFQKVCGIEIHLDWEPAVAAQEPGLEHTMLVRVTRMHLAVIECEGAVHRVDDDYQYFFLRPAKEDEPPGWVIVEWRDIPGPPRG